jgi:hypothetical protein
MPNPRTARKPRAIDDGAPEIRKTDGRTREGRAARAAQAEPQPAPAQRTRAQPREAARAPTRAGAVTVTGRGGEILTRKRTQTGDMFAIPPELIEPGWEYQWAAVTVAGNSEILMDQNLMMAENGWRPVPAERHPGRFMPMGHKGSIIRGGQMLMERPKALCDEARGEDKRKAIQQMRDRDQSLMGRKANVGESMPAGFAINPNQYRGTGGRVKMDIDPAVDVPMPQHQLAELGE